MSEPVGFIGLGVLGSAIAENFLAGGLRVVGFDVSPEAVTKSAELGVEMVQSPKTVAGIAPIIFTCLPNSDALFSVLEGETGLFSETASGQIVAEMSTLSLKDKDHFADLARAAGRHPVDCPVSGNRIMALRRGLTAFCSGAKMDCDRLEPILEHTCKTVHYVGAFGQGSRIKLCGNILNLVHNTVAAEAMVFAMKSGIDPKLFYEVIAGSGSSSAMFESRGKLMVDEDYGKEGMNFSIPIKDARIISDHAASLSCPLPIYQTALQFYHAAVADGLGDLDAAAVCTIMERLANVDRTMLETLQDDEPSEAERDQT